MRFNKFVSRLPQGLIWTFRDRSLIKAEAAREGFKILGSNAAPSIPALARIANDPRLNWKWSGQRAVYSLGDIGEEALPVLVKTLANPHAPNRYLIINQIQRMNDSGVNISLAIPTILQCLSDADTNVVTEAKRQIAELKRQPQLLVSSLTNSLQGSDSHEQLATLKTLADLGDVATLAVPTLISMLSSPNAEVRSAATNLLAAVAPAVMPPNPH
jgi:HEAT repeat protein